VVGRSSALAGILNGCSSPVKIRAIKTGATPAHLSPLIMGVIFMNTYTRQQLGYLNQLLKKGDVIGRSFLMKERKIKSSEQIANDLKETDQRMFVLSILDSIVMPAELYKIMFNDALDQMPLFINVPILSIIAKWRLRIAV